MFNKINTLQWGCDIKTFAQNLKLFRKRQRISTQQLSDMAQVSRSMIYKIENEDTQPSLEMAMRIARALNATLSEMISDIKSATGYVFKQDQQPEWKDPETGIIRRSLLPVSNKNEWARAVIPAKTKSGLVPPLVNKSGYLYVFSGQLSIELGNDEVIDVVEGDLFLIPVGMEHRLHNPSSEPCDFFCLVTLQDTVSVD